MTLREILHKYSGNVVDAGSLPDPDDPHRYVLVERNAQTRGYWITTHDTPAEAADYLDMQEFPDDYECCGLYDTLTDAVLEAVQVTTFVDPQEGEPNG